MSTLTATRPCLEPMHTVCVPYNDVPLFNPGHNLGGRVTVAAHPQVVVRASPLALASAVTVSEVFDKWRGHHSGFIQKFNDEGRKLPIWSNPSDPTKTLPKNRKKKLSILLDRLGDETWTSKSILWEKLDTFLSGVVPIVGVSNSGKTRFLYELLAKDWGFYFTASVHKNGGSGDLETFRKSGVGIDDVANFKDARDRVRCAILSRLLILEYCSKELDDFKPLDWLLLQLEFRSFVDGDVDPFHALSTKLLAVPPADVVSQLRCVWESWHLKHSPNKRIMMAFDEAQVLPHGFAVYETGRGNKRHGFSPFIHTLLKPWDDDEEDCLVLVAGTGLGLLKMEPALQSMIAKDDDRSEIHTISYEAIFSEWKDAEEIRKFFQNYMKISLDQSEMLLNLFRGRRRRCLVTCVEHILYENEGLFSEAKALEAHRRLTERNTLAYDTSIYKGFEDLYTQGKGDFIFREKLMNTKQLLKSIASDYTFSGREQFEVLCEEQELLLRHGVGQLKEISGEYLSFSIHEPVVLKALLNFMRDHQALENYLKEQMLTAKDDRARLGRLWEKLFTCYVPSIFDNDKVLKNLPCFKGVKLSGVFGKAKPKLVGPSGGLVWGESSERTLSTFLRKVGLPGGPVFFHFSDQAGPDLMFLVSIGEFRISVICQLKLRFKVKNWGDAEATTNPTEMYKRHKSDSYHKESKLIMDQACANGCVSFVVAYPAGIEQVGKQEENNRLLGYLGKEELAVMVPPEQLSFLDSPKVKQPARGKASRGKALRGNRPADKRRSKRAKSSNLEGGCSD